jgi:hypothetical protein
MNIPAKIPRGQQPIQEKYPAYSYCGLYSTESR